MADEKLESLKVKYQSALNLMTRLGVQLQNLHVHENKLVIRGHAKTKAETNEVWNQIKLIDANFATDLAAQFTFDTDAPAPAAAAPPPERTYTVQKGDTLSEISQKFYGKAGEYRRIFEANRDQLSDPDKIRPGQTLKIPAGDRVS